MNQVTVVGAGFSGLSLAYQLQKSGFTVEVVEGRNEPGGMLQTLRAENGLIETAANAILADRAIEELFKDIDVPLADRKPERRNRYVFWKEPRRWPLGAVTTAKLTWMMGKARFSRREVWPEPFETVYDWARRTVNAEFEERLLSPALQGVFAGDPKRLSASLALTSLLGDRAPAGSLRGSVAPRDGMGGLMRGLADTLKNRGVKISYGQNFEMKEKVDRPVVLCTSAWTAAEIVKDAYPELSEDLRHCESLSLVSVTCFFSRHQKDLKGFGCLFPTSQGFKSSGVVFNDSIFSNRSEARSETWILGGALQPGIVALSDDELKEAILKDREKLIGVSSGPLEVQITRWPRAIPHYTVQWERILKNLNIPHPLFLHGNYLGGIGLSKIYQRSIRLAGQMKEIYG
jgi:oxygen-dependent protoporphyrinogen oxidase